MLAVELQVPPQIGDPEEPSKLFKQERWLFSKQEMNGKTNYFNKGTATGERNHNNCTLQYQIINQTF